MDAPPTPPAIVRPAGVVPSTNKYHLTFTFDFVPNVTWYAILVKTNGVEAFRRWSMTNVVTVSNLTSDLSRYTFTAIATNSFGVSDETPPAPQRLVILTDGTNTMTMQPTNQTQFFTNLHPMSIRQWTIVKELRKD